MNLLDQIFERAKNNLQRIVLPEGTEIRTLKAADIILKEKTAKLILIGNETEIEKLAAEKKAAKAPVKEKIQVAINGLSLVLPESEVTDNIMEKFNGFKQWALSQAESL